VHDDPTRVMGQPEPDGGRPHGNIRLLVAGLIAVIVGLLIAIFVIAGGDDGDGETVGTPLESTTEATEPTTTETTESETSETTAPETTETTEPTTPTTPEESVTPEEGGGSGGIEVP
jgi:cytoskeletal protein RodZ